MSSVGSRSSSSTCEEWDNWIEIAGTSHIVKKADLSLYCNVKYLGSNKFRAYFALSVASPLLSAAIYEPHITLCYELAASYQEIGDTISRCEAFLESLEDREYTLDFMWWKKGWTLRVVHTSDLYLHVWVPLFSLVHQDVMYSASQMAKLQDPHMSYNPIDGWSSEIGVE